jgi:hypothetical protein
MEYSTKYNLLIETSSSLSFKGGISYYKDTFLKGFCDEAGDVLV